MLNRSLLQLSMRGDAIGRIRKCAARRFQKVCRRRFVSHPPRFECFRRNSRTTHEGPFGEVVRATGPIAKANPFRFSTKYQDDETDLLYYGCRYYAASAGKWLTHDPIGEKGAINSYLFNGNDGVNEIDLLGFVSVARPPFPNLNCCKDPCKDLLEFLKALARHVRGRYNDLLQDKNGLYGSKFQGPMSWQGHQQQFEGQQRSLRDALDTYRDMGCGDPVPVYVHVEALRPVPQEPLRVRFTLKDPGWGQHIPFTPGALDTAGEVSTMVAITAATAATGGAAAGVVGTGAAVDVAAILRTILTCGRVAAPAASF